jgi:hypothetical protein
MLTFVLRCIPIYILPIFASYKALNGNDQTQLTRWTMYWVVVACVKVVEDLVGWILTWYVSLHHISLK